MENRSTWPPFSAILMTAESPARPPPTTIILGVIGIFSCRCSNLRLYQTLLLIGSWRGFNGFNCWACDRLLRSRDERLQAHQADNRDHHEQRHATDQNFVPRLFSDGDSPFCAEEPDAIRKVPRGANQADDVEGQEPGISELKLNFAERSSGMQVQIDSGEA